jgi:hypothetical protein
MNPQIRLKNDKYRKSRGGYSKLLEIFCVNCKTALFSYQKDGPGILKRLYIDRIQNPEQIKPQLICSNCKEVLGTQIIYKKENRPAYRLFAGAVSKKIVK